MPPNTAGDEKIWLSVSKRQSSAWLYGGVGSGVLLGGTIGYFGGRYIVKRSIEKLIKIRANTAR